MASGLLSSLVACRDQAGKTVYHGHAIRIECALGYVQRYGLGIQIAKQQLAAAGHPEPEFDISSHFVRVTVRGREAGS